MGRLGERNKMTTTKLNLGLSISRNYNKVTIELLEEIITHETEEELKTKIREKMNLIRAEVDYEFSKHDNNTKI